MDYLPSSGRYLKGGGGGARLLASLRVQALDPRRSTQRTRGTVESLVSSVQSLSMQEASRQALVARRSTFDASECSFALKSWKAGNRLVRSTATSIACRRAFHPKNSLDSLRKSEVTTDRTDENGWEHHRRADGRSASIRMIQCSGMGGTGNLPVLSGYQPDRSQEASPLSTFDNPSHPRHPRSNICFWERTLSPLDPSAPLDFRLSNALDLRRSTHRWPLVLMSRRSRKA